MRHRTYPPLLILAVLGSGCTDSQGPAGPPAVEQPNYVQATALARAQMPADSTWVVLFHRDQVGNAHSESLSMAGQHGGSVRRVFQNGAGFSAKLAPEAVVALRNNPKVRVIAPNAHIQLASHTTQSSAPWGLDRISVRSLSHMNSTYVYTRDGDGVNIYVVDSGINQHSEFGSRLVDPQVSGGPSDDCKPFGGHGTGVASVAAGSTVGVAKAATVYAFNPMCETGTARIDAAIDVLGWIEQNHAQHGPGVVNLSFGVVEIVGTGNPGGNCGDILCLYGSGVIPQKNAALDTVVVDLVGSGVTVVVAAGNVNVDACRGSPGHLSEVITVAATDASDSRWIDPLDYDVGTNWGSCVDIFAPGTGITAAHKAGGNASAEGTSFAAPFVAGVVALYLEEHSSASPASVKTAIVSRATYGIISNPGPLSPNRILFALAPLEASIDGPTVSGPGDYMWSANSFGAVGHYQYQWYRRWVWPDGYKDAWQTLGSGDEQWLSLGDWEPDLEIRVDVVSDAQSVSRFKYVTGHCAAPCPAFR